MKLRTLRILLIILSLGLSGEIVRYYWFNDSLESIVDVPEYVMVLALVYVFSQIIRRKYSRKQHGWDWLYYLGLIAMIIPTLLADSNNLVYFNYLTDYGTMFLILPVLLEGNYQLKHK
jgi:hypothetical protein